MKMFIACLGTETNTFSPMPTGHETFAETMLYHGDATAHEPSLFSAPLHVWRAAAEAEGNEVVESLAAFAQPAGRTTRAVYEALRDEVLDDLRAAGPVGLVLLNMHGAMVAEGYDDCEGDLLGRVREIVGPDVIVGAELDLHCHITPAMVENADVIVTFKEYPHIDFRERAQDLFDVCSGAARGESRPVMAVFDLEMINFYYTPKEPMQSFVARMQALEGTDGILSISMGHSFPYGDVADVGGKILVVADGDRERAATLARELGEEVRAMRAQLLPPRIGIDEALDRSAEATRGPVVLADVADNAGGGAPSDSTFVLQRVLERGIEGVLSGLYWDPLAVRFCLEAGVGSSLDLRVGGKAGLTSGDPVDLSVEVRAVVRDGSQAFGPSRNVMGDTVWVRSDRGVDLVLNSVRTQVFHPDAFTQLGIDLANYSIIVVKSTQHFYAGFEPIASEIHYVAGPGALPADLGSIPYTKMTAPYWPKVDDPWQA
jgi:microcystin degradation protein MlrC